MAKDWQEYMNKYPSFTKLGAHEQDKLTAQIEVLIEKARVEKWLIEPSELQLGEQIGEGSSSVVLDCVWRGTRIAVKRTRKKRISLLKDLLLEIELWSGLRHPNLVQFMGFTHMDEFMILMERIHGTTLTEFVTSQRKYNKCALARQLINVFLFLHSCKPPVIYRDLKPDNLLVESSGVLKLTDFGLSRFIPEEEGYKMSGQTGTPRYMAPEVALGKHYDLRADVYSIGLVLYFIFTGEKPFTGYTEEQLHDYFKSDNMAFPSGKIRDKQIRDIVDRCVSRNVEERWDIHRVSEEFSKVRAPDKICSIS